MLKEFKSFIMRGNVVDLAIAVILGGAFGKIVTSLVKDIIMPIFGSVIGENFASLSIKINGVAIKYGLFIQTIIDFILVGLVIFLVVKFMNKAKKKEEAAPTAPPAPTADQELLTEIRDLLKK